MNAQSSSPPASPPLGIVEGYFGRPWSWEERTAVMTRLAEWDFSRFTYAPKADVKLRRDWRHRHAAEEAANIEAFAGACKAAGVTFGIGLSPYGLHANLTEDGLADVRRRVADLRALGADRIAILFDDMEGDFRDLAERQARIVEAAIAASNGAVIAACPSYYSDDPVLDRVFGARPEKYLEDLGRIIPADVELYWTGPEVCTFEFTPGHLNRVSAALGRKPTLWDNYPVNDGPRMSKRLHLRAVTGRAGLSGHVAAHDLNPALQPHLSLLPAATLAIAYRDGDAYDYGAAAREAAHDLYPDELAEHILETTLALQDGGIDHIDRYRVEQRYGGIDHPAAEEIMRFARGDYQQTSDEVETQ